jgi:hypothetical protein
VQIVCTANQITHFGVRFAGTAAWDSEAGSACLQIKSSMGPNSYWTDRRLRRLG